MMIVICKSRVLTPRGAQNSRTKIYLTLLITFDKGAGPLNSLVAV